MMNTRKLHPDEIIWELYTDPVIKIDLDGAIVYSNPAFNTLISWILIKVNNIFEIIEITQLQKTHERDVIAFNTWINELRQAAATKHTFITEIADNSTSQPSIKIEAIFDGTNIIFILKIITNTSHSNLGDSFEFSPIAICKIQLDGKISDCNKSFESLTGYNKEEIINQNIDKISPSTWNKIDKVKYIDLLKKGKIEVYEKEIVSKDGTLKSIDIGAILIKDNENTMSIIGYFNDITSTKRRLSIIENREKMIRDLFTKLSKESGDSFFEKLVIEINKAIGCDYTMVGRFGNDQDQMQIISAAHKNKLMAPFSHSIKNSPCRNIAKDGICLHIDNTYLKYENDSFLTENKIRGYVGIPLINAARKHIGALICLSEKPLNNVPLADSLMQLVSYRIISEIERNDLFKQIKENETKFKTIFETSPLPIMIIDINNVTLIDVNNEFVNYTGQSKTDIIGKKLNDINLLQPDQDIDELVTLVTNSNDLLRIEILARNKYNEYRYFEVASILTNINGIDCVVTYGQDIHERKMINQRIRENEELYRSLFNQANDAIFTLSTDLTFTDCNPASYELLHIKREDIIGKTPMDFFLPEQSKDPATDELVKNIYKRTLKGETVRFEWEYLSIDGIRSMTEISLNLFLIKGKPFIQAIVRDITKQKRNQADIFNAAVKAEERERMRIARELHDGISPLLSTVKLYSQAFVNSTKLELQTQLSQRIETTIEEAIVSLAEISNKLSPHILQNFGLVEAIKTFTTNIRMAKNIQIIFESNLKERLPANIETTFYRSLTELVNNTLKHAKASTIEIHLELDKELTMKYSDNGIGFNMSSNKSKGMGLFNLKNRIHSIGGTIVISSNPSKGMSVMIKSTIHEPEEQDPQ